MKELVNSFDKEVSFTNLEDAKKYYQPSEFPEYLKQWDEYKNAIKSAETLEELADALNEWSNIFDNGAVYSVKEYQNN